MIVLAMAECFQDQRLAACTGSGSNKRDLGLAKAVCLLPPKAQYTRKAQGFLFCLLINVTRNPSTALLASNNSASGLLDGLFGLIQVFYVKCLKAGSQKDGSEQAPFLDSNNKVVNRDAAAAYCSLRILESLSKEPQNRSRIVQHKGFPMLIGPLFTHAKLPECFLLSIMSMVQECYPLLLSTTGEVVLEVLGDGLLSRLEESANIGGGCSNEGTEEREAEKGDMEVCSKALTILGSYSQNIGLESKCLSRLIITICKLLHCQHAIANTRGLAVVVYNLTARFPGVVSESVDFIQGVFKLLRDTRCTEKVLEALRLIQREKPLQEYAKDVGLMGQWVKRCEENKAIEEAHEAAISQAQNGKIGEAVRGADITDLFHVNDFDLGAESMNGPGGGIDFEGLLFPSEDFDILDAGGIPKNDPLLGDY